MVSNVPSRDIRPSSANESIGSRGPAVLDEFTASYGYKFSDAAGYQWPTTETQPLQNKL